VSCGSGGEELQTKGQRQVRSAYATQLKAKEVAQKEVLITIAGGAAQK
jgi:hypothetical protein